MLLTTEQTDLLLNSIEFKDEMEKDSKLEELKIYIDCDSENYCEEKELEYYARLEELMSEFITSLLETLM